MLSICPFLRSTVDTKARANLRSLSSNCNKSWSISNRRKENSAFFWVVDSMSALAATNLELGVVVNTGGGVDWEDKDNDETEPIIGGGGATKKLSTEEHTTNNNTCTCRPTIIILGRNIIIMMDLGLVPLPNKHTIGRLYILHCDRCFSIYYYFIGWSCSK